MDIESFSFVVRTTIVGMLIVFLFLGALSILMVLIRRLFDPVEPQVSKEAKRHDNSTTIAHTKSSSSETTLPQEVVIAVAAAFLDDNAMQAEARAEPWAAHINGAPWEYKH